MRAKARDTARRPTGRATSRPRASSRADRPVIAIAWPKPDYLTSLERAGAKARVLRPDHDPLPAALDDCDGVLLTGGADVDPALYGESVRHPSVEIDRERDAYEIALTRHALDRELPLLAICRGVQLLNVAGGGTLIQDIPSSLPDALTHKPEGAARPKHEPGHAVSIRPRTGLARLLRTRASAKGQVPVNSRHHQAIREVAPGFVVSATAADGIVEAIERAGKGFCVGVQWHPENYWRTGEFAELFEGLVESAARRRTAAGER